MFPHPTLLCRVGRGQNNHFLMSRGRFELPTQGFSVLCSNQLSYLDYFSFFNIFSLLHTLFCKKLGWKGSNLWMSDPNPDALPLGYTPFLKNILFYTLLFYPVQSILQNRHPTYFVGEVLRFLCEARKGRISKFNLFIYIILYYTSPIHKLLASLFYIL